MSSKQQTQKLQWAREEDEDWAASVELRLVLDHDAPPGLADEVLAEAHETAAQAPESTARELFGEADAYARVVAAERIGEEYRARTDTEGLSPGERLSATLLTLGFVGAVLSLFHWAEDGLWARWSWSSLAGLAGVATAAVLVGTALAVRATGRIRAAWACAAAAVAAMAGGAAVAGAAPDTPLFSVPAPLLTVVCAAWMWAVTALPDAALDRRLTPKALLTGDDEQWLARLSGLLRGRHSMTASEARGHVQEARQHLASAPRGEHAEDAFGDVEIYALRLSEGPRKHHRKARRRMYGAAAMTVVFTILLIDDLTDPSERTSPWMAVPVGALAFWIWTLLTEWRRARESDD